MSDSIRTTDATDRAPRRPRRGPRLLFAALVAPLALVPAVTLWVLGVSIAAGGLATSKAHSLGAAVLSGFLLGGFGLVIALPMTLAILLPIALLLRRLGRSGPVAITMAGAIIGMPIGAAEGPLSAGLYTFCGAAIGLAFWALGRESLRPE